MLDRIVVIITTYQTNDFQKELLNECIISINTYLKNVEIIILNDNHTVELLLDFGPNVNIEKTKFPRCGEVNAYSWACKHMNEFDKFIFIHDSTVILKELPLDLPEHFRPFWYTSKYTSDNLIGGGVEEIMKRFTVRGHSCNDIYQALVQNKGSIVFGGMAIFDRVFIKFLAEETNFQELAHIFNTRFLRCFFERLLYMVYCRFGDSTKFVKSALCGDIFNHRDAFKRNKGIQRELANNPYVLKVWQGR